MLVVVVMLVVVMLVVVVLDRNNQFVPRAKKSLLREAFLF